MSREFPKNPEPKIALPTVGRIVLFTRPGLYEPVPAIVTGLGDDEYLVHLEVFGVGDDRYTRNTPHAVANKDFGAAVGTWDWMDYQKGQAAKADELEKQIDSFKAGHQQTGLRASPSDLDKK